jgi:hypothetical protein
MQPTYWARAHVWNRAFASDIFVWLDTVKFSRSATKWEDRTIVESTDGRPVVLRLPLRGARSVAWADARLNDNWQRHERTIRHCYSNRRHWQVVAPVVTCVYAQAAATIDEVCWRTMAAVAGMIAAPCRFVRASELDVTSAKGQLVLDLVTAVQGTSYLTGGPGASYLDANAFQRAGVAIEVQDWEAPRTRHGLKNPSILHLLADLGVDATRETLTEAGGTRDAQVAGCRTGS